MSWQGWLDAYEVKARLFPAFLAVLVPGTVTAVGVGLNYSSVSLIVSVLSGAGVFFLVAILVRGLGKSVERRNFKKWGGAPSTLLLRHADTSIDPVTKSRYHAFLSAAMGQDFPSLAEEQRDPASADQLYDSAVLWLRSRTGDHDRFRILFHENIAYGFARNGQGLRPIALLLSLAAGVWILYADGITGLQHLLELPLQGVVLLGACAGSALLWTIHFRQANTKRVALTYAHALLRACDELSVLTRLGSKTKLILPPSEKV